MYYLFVKNLRRGLDIYIQNPVFNSSRSNNFDQLRKTFRDVFRPKAIGSNQNRDTIQNIMSDKDNCTTEQQLYSKISPKNLIYNADGVRQ